MLDENRPPLASRRDLIIVQTEAEPEPRWTVKDPLSLKYFHLRAEERFVLQQLDGTTSYEQILANFAREFSPLQLRSEELLSFIERLWRQGLLMDHRALPAELWVAKRRAAATTAGRWWQNPLVIRWRGIDPDPFVSWLYQVSQRLWTPFVGALGMTFVLSAVLLVLVEFSTILRAEDWAAMWNVKTLGWAILALSLVKVLHELGHALALKHAGGECHELGLMLLVGTPCLYCNVSDAWLLPHRWRRIGISAAGIVVELLLASVATWLWWFSRPGGFHAFCLAVMLVCSINTLLLNGNPLMRYDGYFILADFVRVPNLRAQAQAAWRNWLAKLCLGVADFDVNGDSRIEERPGRRLALLTYGGASQLYQWFALAGILWFLHRMAAPWGLSLISGLFALSLILSQFRGGWTRWRFAWRDWRQSGRLTPSQAYSRGGLTLAILLLLLFVPWPLHVNGPVTARPTDAKSVYVTTPGQLLRRTAPQVRHESNREWEMGDSVKAGETLAILTNPDLELELLRLTGLRDRQRQIVANLEQRQFTDPTAVTQLSSAQANLADFTQRQEERSQAMQRLHLNSPLTGTLISASTLSNRSEKNSGGDSFSDSWFDERSQGAWLETGTALCQVSAQKSWEAVMFVDQADVSALKLGTQGRVVFSECPGQAMLVEVVEISELDRHDPFRDTLRESVPLRQQLQREANSGRVSYEVRLKLLEAKLATPLLFNAPGQAHLRAGSLSIFSRTVRFLHWTFAI